MKVTVRDPQGRPVELVGSPFHIDGASPSVMAHPPGLGQDTEGVLQELLGLDANRIEELRRQGVI
jgi:crotonobetainyl-CoA:carnitine CoA-transferase CaiB-like acyl-CoA transferase